MQVGDSRNNVRTFDGVSFHNLVFSFRQFTRLAQDFVVDAALELGILKLPLISTFLNALQNWALRSAKTLSTISPLMLEKLKAKLGKIKAPPLTVAVISRVRPGEIPEWEQRLSAGAVCMTLIVAAQAMGYGANWITDWYAYDEAALRLLGLREGEQVAGYVHLGTSAEAPLERVRPDVSAIVEAWRG